jgi:thymidylate synthase (FAD)
MEVRLIAYMQVNPDLGIGSPSPEEIASACMHRCRTTKGFSEIVDEQTEKEVTDRLYSAVKLGHFTVAGMTDWTFEINGVSRTLTHQLVRHRTAWFLQQSQRSVDPTDEDDWYVTPPSIGDNEEYKFTYDSKMSELKGIYKLFWKYSKGVPKEDARFILPNATKSDIIMKIDGSNLMHFLKLRLDRGAQWEIRELAERIYELVKEKAPNLFREDLQECWW